MLVLPYNDDIIEEASDYLSASELDYFNSITNKFKKRKSEWLAGRIASKKVISEYYNKINNPLDFKKIIVKNKKSGQPYFQNLNLSISHTDKFAVAEISDSGLIGIDIENIKKIPDLVTENFLTKMEKDIINCRPENEKISLITLFWSLKESYLKALGKGIRKHPVVIGVEELDGIFRITQTNPEVKCLWYNINHQDNYVVTKVILNK